MLTIDATNAKTLEGAQHAVPKEVIPNHPNGKLYYVEINAHNGTPNAAEGFVVEYDPKTKTTRHIEAPDGKNEQVTALGLNHDGSLLVARQSGIYYLSPGGNGADEWRKVCDITLEENERTNNGAMIECHDGKTRFFLGTGAIKPSADAKAGKLYVLEADNGGKFALRKLKDGMVMTNAVSGQLLNEGTTRVTFADSFAEHAVLNKADFMPSNSQLVSVTPLKDFKNGEAKAIGRPDGTAAFRYQGTPAIAVAAIDKPEIQLLDADTGKQFGVINLPKDAHMPTMPTFYKDETGHTKAYVTTLRKNPETDAAGGKIYTIDLPDGFEPLNYQGSYLPLSALKSRDSFVSPKAGGQTL